ncbi:hypothetical protein CDD81_2709 [Ophiocordyceps australis]|uniref:Uncharacterized protein n=1 Tax=Ophiocordyceps australis TaxID=1399860 RepID=A0A2C5Y9A5_9HYPO|nr:hypothetical protein CDD81_2709 [Ophiocordyceps australis]
MADRPDFNATLTRLTEELVEKLRSMGYPRDAAEMYRKCLLINTQGGKLHRCWTVLDTGKTLRHGALTEIETEDLMVLGWLVEMLSAGYLIWDDIMDQSETRRGKPCWYLREDVGLMSINDGCLLVSSVFILLKSHFKNHPAYHDLVDMFQETALQIELGQGYDMLTASRKYGGLKEFTRDKYDFIVEHKTAYYTSYTPMALPLVYLGLATPKNLKELYKVATVLGQYYQARNDYFDVYGDSSSTGKKGNDVQENKLTWIVLEAMERCDEEQKTMLEKYYGSQVDEDVAKVLALFQQLNLDRVFRAWQEKKLALISQAIDDVDETEGLDKRIFEAFVSKLDGDGMKKVGVSVC